MMTKLWGHAAQRTIPEVIADAARKWSNQRCLSQGERRFTYAEVDGETNRLAHGLAALGVKQGDVVCTMLDNSADAILIWYAINKLGAVSAPVNTSYKGEFLCHQIADCGAAVMITESHYLGTILGLLGQLPSVNQIVRRGDGWAGECPLPLLDHAALRSSNERPVDVVVGPADLAMLIYTSGTTGRSKGCMISHNYACQHAKIMNMADSLREGDVIWNPLPIFHLTGCAGLTLAALIAGAAVEIYPKFSVSNFWPEIERVGATVAVLVGSMLSLIAGAPDDEAAARCFGQLRYVCGAPSSEALKAVWKRRFGVCDMGSPGYGQTEASLVLLRKPGEYAPDGTSGRRIPEYDVRVVGDDGAECLPGVPGEIIIRPNMPNIMYAGYWHRPEETLRAREDLWHHTGDIGVFDAEGYFTFVDRKKDYLRRGGENISSTEMEAVFIQHPDIEDVAVHAVASDLAEDDLKVTAVLKPGAALSAADLCRWSQERVPSFAVPRYIEFRADLPRTPNGKIQKFELRSEGVTATTWDRRSAEGR